MKKHILTTGITMVIFHCLSFGQGSTYGGTYTDSSPIAWESVSNRTISKLKIINPSGHCIKLCNCSNITIQYCKLGPSLNEGVYLYNCSNITITNCSMDSIDSGVVADGCTGIKVINNDVKNVMGPMPRGQMVQFGNVYGGGNVIGYNVVDNVAGQSFPEDAISLYMSNGATNDPIQVVGNWIRGGGPSTSGGGIMTGDMGGSNILVKDNILVNPGQYGITISSGVNISILNNKIYSDKEPYSNIGLSAYRQYDIVTTSNTISYNEVNFKNKDGVLNCMWDAGNCGVIAGWNTNIHNSNLTAAILPAKIIGRVQSITTEDVPAPNPGSINIYPNPATDYIMIDSSPDLKNSIVSIYNINGQKMIEEPVTENSTMINTHNLAAAVYILKIIKDNKTIEVKKITIGKM
ncbi:MAG: right-handed parallel beta-helix repeat-containing protein [Paludibacter sp.]|nr:right-handed parallel beta-helix repeat-containing protein [Paludibacter sp.]